MNNEYCSKKKKRLFSQPFIFGVLILLLLISIYFGARVGAVEVENATILRLLNGEATAIDNTIWQILVNIRFPRVIAAVLVGGTLAITGAIMQGLFRNPLVDPGIIGVMSGASFSATLFIVLGSLLLPLPFVSNNFTLPFFAFLGGWGMTMVLYSFSKKGGVLNISSMLLIGIAFGALTGALTGLLTYVADDVQLRSIAFWGMGSLTAFDWEKLAILSVVCIVTLPLLWRDSAILNALMLGENVAGHLGFDIEKAKQRQILLVALLVGVCVAFSGGIGFIGLVVPHIVRRLVGSDHRLVLPASFLFGAILLTLSDVISRIIIMPAELPIGILTAMIGAPFLGFLVWRGAR
ncbi:FecCD family ABC transporter permease [Phocoenobacter skyensis]|uniref:Iron ABC transporter permease n=1 Tax=Phocoenobacter skyensis TaxID=97481 RepID=A0A1H7Y0S1_9PAST|nr:iron ABC transporter permease [Pasteurella skyensis]MDP8079798.1 iron ABC transporter permease [Pasteurella skyensis]MDP8085733.1 iron ABC transporter permease [Pasteurella skyensis]MDP8171172.1 iron ABC transporter permease [Pasteurella skyensis]MDP8174993.1 iron ABC transporter permease [Pasteurella skyensis]MDP8185561.1 iron ABC transporter permease [Pasteurella skyensis]